MHTLFADVLDRCVVVYLDDILIYSNTESKHEEHVSLVLDRLLNAQFYCKLSKCEFFKSAIKFLGHEVSAKGIAIDGAKSASVREWPEPTNVKELQ